MLALRVKIASVNRKQSGLQVPHSILRDTWLSSAVLIDRILGHFFNIRCLENGRHGSIALLVEPHSPIRDQTCSLDPSHLPLLHLH